MTNQIDKDRETDQKVVEEAEKAFNSGEHSRQHNILLRKLIAIYERALEVRSCEWCEYWCSGYADFGICEYTKKLGWEISIKKDFGCRHWAKNK